MFKNYYVAKWEQTQKKKKKNYKSTSSVVSHSFEMVLHLEHLQVSAPGKLNGLLAAQDQLVSQWSVSSRAGEEMCLCLS